MKKLFLASVFSDIAQCLPAFAGFELAGKTVAFIPTASLVEQDTAYVDADRDAFRALGMQIVETELTTDAESALQKKIAAADCVFVSGGNVFYLLQALQRSGADAMIAKHIGSGKLYVGESAGSVITAPDIGYARHMDDPAFAPALNGDYRSLNIVPFSVVPHCDMSPFKEAAAVIEQEYRGTLDLRMLDNNQAVTVEGEREAVITGETAAE